MQNLQTSLKHSQNQFLALDFFAASYSKIALVLSFWKREHMPLDFKATNLPKNKRRQKKSQRGIKPRFGIRKNSKWVNLIFSNLILNSVDDNVHSVSKSLYISHGVSNLLEQKFRFGLVLCRLVVLKKKFGPIMSNFWGRFFHVVIGKKNNFFLEIL